MAIEPIVQNIGEASPQQRLESTRKALAEQLARRGKYHRARDAAILEDSALPADGLAARARRAARVWWNRHPVHDAVDFARPALEDYARHKPMQLVGLAAGAGAALTLLKSWRLLSLTGVALAMVKTSNFKAVAKTLASPIHSPTSPQRTSRRTSP